MELIKEEYSISAVYKTEDESYILQIIEVGDRYELRFKPDDINKVLGTTGQIYTTVLNSIDFVIVYADFTIDYYEYSKIPIKRQYVMDFFRESTATDLVDGEVIEYDINEPRISDRGLLIEPENGMQSPDIIRIEIPEDTKVIGDWDLGINVTYNGSHVEISSTEPSYIRKLEVVKNELYDYHIYKNDVVLIDTISNRILE